VPVIRLNFADSWSLQWGVHHVPKRHHRHEHQIFELIINLVSLQPIAEDHLEAEDCRLRQVPAMVIALSLPLFTPDFSDPP
jgi:hypothetical protein